MGAANLSHAQDLTGTFSVSTPNGELRLALQPHDGREVSGLLLQPDGRSLEAAGTLEVDDEDGEASVEGTLSDGQPRGEFSLDGPDEDGEFYLMITPYDGSGIPQLAQSVSYVVERIDTEANLDAKPKPLAQSPSMQPDTHQPGPGSATPGLDQRLVGVWSTQVIMNTPGGTVSTLLQMEIRADGTIVDLGSRSMGGIPGFDIDTGMAGAGESANWTTQGNVLLMSQNGSPWVPLAQFEVTVDRLLLAYFDGDRKLWHRQ
jgi:hypothetical protein